MASHSSGADVFLVKPDGKYLGCTCPWKNCGPGYRASCDAEHCGLRPYLHDDLGSIRLTPEVIAQPPVMLWPDPISSPHVPGDVRAQLTEPLSQDADR